MSLYTATKHRIMGVSAGEATAFSPGNTPVWQHLEQAVLAAVGGYNTVLGGSNFDELIPRLDQVPVALRGYAYEGAAMGLTGLDAFTGSRRFLRYLNGPARRHAYMVHIGAGEAMARLRRNPLRLMKTLDPILGWLVMDGYGFHEGFFKPHRFIISTPPPPAWLPAPAARVFDQGLGRSLWFTCGGDPAAIARSIHRFPSERHQDLWTGVGVGVGYVGGVTTDSIEQLQQLAGRHAPRLGIGTAFVAKGRTRAGNMVPDTETACQILCGIDSSAAAALVDQAFRDAADDTAHATPYEALQTRLEQLLSQPLPQHPGDNPAGTVSAAHPHLAG